MTLVPFYSLTVASDGPEVSLEHCFVTHVLRWTHAFKCAVVKTIHAVAGFLCLSKNLQIPPPLLSPRLILTHTPGEWPPCQATGPDSRSRTPGCMASRSEQETPTRGTRAFPQHAAAMRSPEPLGTPAVGRAARGGGIRMQSGPGGCSQWICGD